MPPPTEHLAPSPPAVGARELWTAVLLLAALHAALFSGVLLAGRSLAPGDGALILLPAYHAERTLWTATLFSGYPAAADPQNLTWYPPAFLGKGLGLPFEAFVVAAYFLASLFQCLFVAKLTRSASAGLVAGIVLGAGGFFTAHLGHANMLHAAAWIPLLLLALEFLRERISAGALALAAVATALAALAGHPQILVKALLLAALWSVFRASGASAGAGRFVLAAAGALALGLLLAAPLLLPMWELASLTERSETGFDFFRQGSFPPWQLPTLFFPQAAGGWKTAMNGVGYFGDWFVSDLTVYTGSMALLLAGAAFGGRTARVARFWACVAAVAFVLALGDATPLASVLYHVPLLGMFRSPCRYFLEVTLGVSVLAGLGLARLGELPRRERLRVAARSAVCVAALYAAALATLLVATSRWAGAAREKAGVESLSVVPWKNPAVGMPLILLGLSALAFIAFATSASRLARAGLFAACAGELAFFSSFPVPSNFPLRAEILREPAAVRLLAKPLRETSQRYAPLLGAHQDFEAAIPDHSRLWNLPNASGRNPLLLKAYADLLGMERWGEMSRDVLRPQNRALDVLATRFLLVPRELAEEVRRADGGLGRWAYRTGFSKTDVFENLHARPRAWLVREAVPLEDAVAVATLRTSRFPDGRAFDPAETALVEVGKGTFSAMGDPEASAAVASLGEDALRLVTSSRGPSFLVVSDVFYPGWRAAVDRREAEIVRTDVVLRGLALAAGRHEVLFEFRPPLFRIGIGLSVVGAALLVAATLLLRRPSSEGPLRAPSR